jgi:glucose-6-phosphate 1-dehydrogenase
MAEQPKVAFEGNTPLPAASSHRITSDSMATIVIFGATGDLASRKLIPAIYNLWVEGYLPKRIAVVGVARRAKGEAEFRAEMCEALKEHSRSGHGSSETCDPFVSNLHYHQLDFGFLDGYEALGQRLAEIESTYELPGNRLYYMAVAPEHFGPLVERLGRSRLIRPGSTEPWYRVVFEKPFGEDLATAQALNRHISGTLDENQAYRIDHYLGKETVQNIFAFRFGNAIFEPLFNQHYVDHVQITMAETVGMEGRRGGFYDRVGALRDVVQNHLLQLLCLVAMEPPSTFSAKEVRDEKVKVLRSVVLPESDDPNTWCVRGQYAEGTDINGYLSEEGVAPGSTTETFAALRLYVDNWRWAGVPFLLRSGKRLKKRMTEIAIRFKHPPTHFFRNWGVALPPPNVLAFRIQPDEAISLTFNAKPPGMAFQTQPVNMDFCYGQTFEGQLPEAYERLLLDVLRGDSTLFMRSDEIEAAWEIVTRVRHVWERVPSVELYRPYSWGPEIARNVFIDLDASWRTP